MIFQVSSKEDFQVRMEAGDQKCANLSLERDCFSV